MRYYIDNKLAFLSAILAFFGSLFITLDRFDYFHERFSETGQWKRISSGLQKLDKMNSKSADGKPLGVLTDSDQGFVELAKIISLNRPDLAGEKISIIAKNKPVTVAGLDIPTIHVGIEGSNQGKPVAFEFGLMQWISSYRTEWFLYRGFALVSIGFFLGIISRIKRKQAEPFRKADSEPSQPIIHTVPITPAEPPELANKPKDIANENPPAA
jgi:hypothetical protein